MTRRINLRVMGGGLRTFINHRCMRLMILSAGFSLLAANCTFAAIVAHGSPTANLEVDLADSVIGISGAPVSNVLVPVGPPVSDDGRPADSGIVGIPGSGTGFTPVLQPGPPSLPNSLGTFSIQLNAGPNLQANTAALGAFQRAAQQWINFISDPVTVSINAEIRPFMLPNGQPNNTTLGQTLAPLVAAGFDVVRNQMVLDASDEPDDGIVASLPMANQFAATVPANVPIQGGTGNFTIQNAISLTRANGKALSFVLPPSSLPNNADALIEFNSNFGFDFDNSNGVSNGLTDFETVAAHEIGHALGFVSEVDVVDFIAGNAWQDPSEMPADPAIDFPNPFPLSVRALDLFRFSDGVNGSDPDTAAQFTTNARDLNPNAGTDIFDQVNPSTMAPANTAAEQPFSTGLLLGNGRQASHWFPDEQDPNNTLIGQLDPTLAAGGNPTFPAVINISGADLRALDVIGWDIGQIPEPSSLLVAAALAMACGGMRRRH